ncbi:IclR family transcriptional regulator C-terminal domain-containing protein [Bradyrhizobium sp. AS23.2]|uniref:IclR family transcriptional regulator n=1 Tax=Bradyrhizobium sp. AS23.2 TaxID=1680155 RepID=UPI00093C444E|nr:IclR family transcriptional regulator C-terminal domain-containing protein [Bradyrhizobium sp. AS23.2]OKO74274.1 transcriptional regulator [Bradyrhizobium sp. AS23.2]
MSAQGSVIKTARRIFEVLEYFDEVQQPTSLKEMSVHFGYPVSSASVLLKSMVVMGYLDYDSYSRTYMPTMRVAMLGNWVQGALFGESRILALMKHMSDETGETISLGTQSDLLAQYIHVVPSQYAIRYHLKSGAVRPLARSGIGCLLLSARTDETIDRLLRRINIEEEPDARIALPDLMQRIREIREQGYVFSRNTLVDGIGLIGMLLPIRRHGRILAIGVGGPLDRLDKKKDKILKELREGIARFVERGE